MSATYPLLLIWGNVVFKYVKWSVPSTEDGSWLWLHSQPGCERWKTTYPYLSESQFRDRNKWVLDHLKEIKFFFHENSRNLFPWIFKGRVEYLTLLLLLFFAGGLEFAVMLLYSLFISEPIDMCGSDYLLFMFLFMIATTKNVLEGNTWPFFFMLLYKRGFFFCLQNMENVKVILQKLWVTDYSL